MDQLFASLPSWLGTLPQLISAIGITGLFGLALKFYLGKGALGIKTRQVNLQANEIEDKAEATLREHYAAELARLAERVSSAEQRQQECEEREQAVRERLRRAEDDILGLQRIIAAGSAAQILDLSAGGMASEDVRNAAIRVLENIAAGKRPSGEDS